MYCIGKISNVILPEDEGIVIFRIVENCNPNYTASHPRILESFLTNSFLRNAGRTTHQTTLHHYSSVLKTEATDVPEQLLPVSQTRRHHSLDIPVRNLFLSHDILYLVVINAVTFTHTALFPFYISFKVKLPCA